MISDADAGARSARLPMLGLPFVLTCALAVRMFFASAYPTLLWSDEIFQTLEQAHRLVFGYGIVPWEFRAGARS